MPRLTHPSLKLRLTVSLLMLSSLPLFTTAHTVTHTKEWNTATIIGSFTADKQWKYTLQPTLRFRDDKYKYESTLLFAGLGYQANTDTTVWLLGGRTNNRRTSGNIENVNVIRQQTDVILADNAIAKATYTNRLEARKNTSESEWAYRVREMLTARLPFASWQGHCLTLINEAIFSINHPAWINSTSLLEQNRAFIGIGTTLSSQVSFDIGYLNQYQIRQPNEMSNILFLFFNVNL